MSRRDNSWAFAIPFMIVGFAALGCAALSSVTPAERAKAYEASAKSVGTACKAYAFDRATGLVPEVPDMAKLCADK